MPLLTHLSVKLCLDVKAFSVGVMFIPKIFEEKDITTIHSLIENYGFATLVSNAEKGLWGNAFAFISGQGVR